MRLAFLAAGLALAFSLPAQAASYSVTTNPAQEAAITAARTVYDNGLPACSAPTNNCASDPNYQATNGAFLLQVMTNAMTGWNSFTSIKATLAPADQTNAQTLLNACISANGLGGLTSAQCLSLLTAVQAAH